MIDLIIALEAELDGRSLPPGYRVMFCGVGKINAALAALGDTPFEEGPAVGVIDLGGDGFSLSTGDNFVTAPPALASDIVDMEAYAMAKACLRADRPFSCYKYVTDLADENATCLLYTSPSPRDA